MNVQIIARNEKIPRKYNVYIFRILYWDKWMFLKN